MVENKSSLFGIIAIIIGASGLGVGAFSVINFQVLEGPQGIPGDDGHDGVDGLDGINGTDGHDAPGGIAVGILDPDDGDLISGEIIIRAMISGSDNYNISVLRNGTVIGDLLPLIWNTQTVSNGWWNITIQAMDINNNNTCFDEILIYAYNGPNDWSELLLGDYSSELEVNEESPPFITLDFEFNYIANFEVVFFGRVHTNIAAGKWIILRIKLDGNAKSYFILLNEEWTYITVDFIFNKVPPRTPYHTVEVSWYNVVPPSSGWHEFTCGHLATLNVYKI